MNRKSLAILLYVLLGALLFSELWFSNIGSFGNVEALANDFGITPAAERIRLYILIVFDAIGGLGALIALAGLAVNAIGLTKQGIRISFFGTAGYGVYQILAALFQLAPQWRMTISIAGLIYIGFALLTRLVGNLAVEQMEKA